MQNKLFVILSFLLLPIGLQAQSMKAPDVKGEADSVVSISADNAEAHSREIEVNAFLVNGNSHIAKYKPVPLAGQKAYFGDMNDFVMGFAKRYLELHNQTLSIVQNRGGSNFPLMDNVLQKNNIPKELKYLAVIESALNNNAISPVGAVGPWQFMATTGQLMGLKVSGGRDERRDWYKSTVAASKYLSILYNKLNDWLLVVAAYNCGPTPVVRAMQRTGSKSFWDIKSMLPMETQGHVLAFIATATIFESLSKFIGLGTIPGEYKFGEDTGPLAAMQAKKAAMSAAEKKKAAVNVSRAPVYSPEELQAMTIIRITEPLSIELLAQELTIDKNLLNKWNPDYDMYVMKAYPTDYYKFRMPKDKLDKFLEKKENLVKRSKQIFSAMVM